MAKVLHKSAAKLEISLNYLHDIAEGSNEFMVEMIDIFLNQTPGYINEIDTAISSGDWSVVAEIAHKVRPTFAFIGVEEASNVMAKIENLARSADQSATIKSEFEKLKPLLGSVFQRLNEIRNELSAE